MITQKIAQCSTAEHATLVSLSNGFGGESLLDQQGGTHSNFALTQQYIIVNSLIFRYRLTIGLTIDIHI